MQQRKLKNMVREKKITDKYYHGAAKAVATQLGLSEKYIGDVLSGMYDGDHYTQKRKDTVKKIKTTAEPFKK